MSGRLATPPTKRRTAAFAAFVALCAGVVGLGTAGFGGNAVAQPPNPPTKDEPKPVDRNNPVPADAPRRQVYAKFAIPNPDRIIFSRIEDLEPVASEADNRDEYDAWCEFVTHAKQFTASDLEQAAARDLTPIDLIKPNRSLYRLELLRFRRQGDLRSPVDRTAVLPEQPGPGSKGTLRGPAGPNRRVAADAGFDCVHGIAGSARGGQAERTEGVAGRGRLGHRQRLLLQDDQRARRTRWHGGVCAGAGGEERHDAPPVRQCRRRAFRCSRARLGQRPRIQRRSTRTFGSTSSSGTRRRSPIVRV